jgi:hypothetical protein
MRVRNGDLFRISEALTKLSEEKFPIAFSFKVSRLMNSIEAQSNLYNESRSDLIDRYAKRDDDGEKISRDAGMTVEMESGWREELSDLDAIEGDEVPELRMSELITACDKVGVNLAAKILFGISSILIDDVSDENEDN